MNINNKNCTLAFKIVTDLNMKPQKQLGLCEPNELHIIKEFVDAKLRAKGLILPQTDTFDSLQKATKQQTTIIDLVKQVISSAKTHPLFSVFWQNLSGTIESEVIHQNMCELKKNEALRAEIKIAQIKMINCLAHISTLKLNQNETLKAFQNTQFYREAQTSNNVSIKQLVEAIEKVLSQES